MPDIDPIQEQKRRGFSFWQPSVETSHVLEQCVNKGATIDASILTSPSVLVETQMVRTNMVIAVHSSNL